LEGVWFLALLNSRNCTEFYRNEIHRGEADTSQVLLAVYVYGFVPQYTEVLILCTCQ